MSDGKKAQGMMHLAALDRSPNGAVFAVLQTETGYTFQMPIADLFPTMQVLFGTRFVKLKPDVYYGRAVHKFDNSR